MRAHLFGVVLGSVCMTIIVLAITDRPDQRDDLELKVDQGVTCRIEGTVDNQVLHCWKGDE